MLTLMLMDCRSNDHCLCCACTHCTHSPGDDHMYQASALLDIICAIYFDHTLTRRSHHT